MTRIDRYLVEQGLARSRAHARELISQGHVLVDEQPVAKPSDQVSRDHRIQVTSNEPTWVGRGAYKLQAALEAFAPRGLRISRRRAIDVGASTGGFTQVLLAHGIEHVVALDVGHAQLAPALRADPRVTDASGHTVRGVEPLALGGPFDLLVCDVSFISLTVVMADLVRLVGSGGDAIILVKPQFEVGRDRLGKGGIVRRESDRLEVATRVAEAMHAHGWSVLGAVPSPVTGTNGNQELLIWATAAADVPNENWRDEVRQAAVG